MAGTKIEQMIEINESQLAWLREMVDKHGLPDEGKAVRCMINHLREQPELEDDAFSDIRCFDC
jgi:hypothetical protein